MEFEEYSFAKIAGGIAGGAILGGATMGHWGAVAGAIIGFTMIFGLSIRRIRPLRGQ